MCALCKSSRENLKHSNCDKKGNFLYSMYTCTVLAKCFLKLVLHFSKFSNDCKNIIFFYFKWVCHLFLFLLVLKIYGSYQQKLLTPTCKHHPSATEEKNEHNTQCPYCLLSCMCRRLQKMWRRCCRQLNSNVCNVYTL